MPGFPHLGGRRGILYSDKLFSFFYLLSVNKNVFSVVETNSCTQFKNGTFNFKITF